MKWLLGGRPMLFLQGAFLDQVTGEPVSYYMDNYGRTWLATGAWALFRVKARWP